MTRNTDVFRSFIKNYWHYYRELEDEFLATKRYVEFSEDNDSTYSIEFLKLFEAVCGEIDVIGKSLAQSANPDFKPDDKQNNIYKWWYEIQDKFLITEVRADILKDDVEKTALYRYECDFLRDRKLIPWKGYRTEYYQDSQGHRRTRSIEDTDPKWWSDYNKVKHGRALPLKDDPKRLNFSKANLKNPINAFAGLYVLEMAFMEACGTRDDLEAFADHSVLFEYEEYATTSEIDDLLQ